MTPYNPQFDDYIAESADFARPILEYLRKIIHETCPEVEEIMKWGNLHFDYKGDIMCILTAYKKHCSFSLFKAELMSDPKLIESVKAGKKMGYMDKVTSLSDLPPKAVLVAYIKEAMILNETGVKKIRPKSEKQIIIDVPDYFNEKLTAHPLAKEIFESKSASFRKDYLIWITGAKTEATRQTRMEQSLDWIAKGKGRFWQYEKK
jgi:uncharacterized protein YdeI (YjbR/CyaY-like superfamily)